MQVLSLFIYYTTLNTLSSLFLFLSIYLCLILSLPQPIYLYLSIYLSICLSACVSFSLSPYFYLSIYLSLSLSLSLSRRAYKNTFYDLYFTLLLRRVYVYPVKRFVFSQLSSSSLIFLSTLPSLSIPYNNITSNPVARLL